MTGGRFMIGAWLVGEDRDQAYDGSSEVENLHQERTRIKVPVLTLDARVTERFGVQAGVSIPDITRTAVIPRPTGAFNFKETFSGLGDMSVLGWYRLPTKRDWNIVVNFGASLPTGRTEQPRFRLELEGGSLVPMSRLQRGSGTFDPLFGLTATHRVRPGTLFGSLAARTPVNENTDGLRTGASWEIGGGLAHQVGTHRVTALGRVGWLHREQDVFRGTPVLVGGGDWLYLTPGLAVQVGKGVNVQAEVKVPVRRSLANKQLDSSAIFQFGISRVF